MALVRRYYRALSPNHLPDVMRPILLLTDSVNQRLPPSPAVIPGGPLEAVGRGNSVMRLLGLMRPIWLLTDSVNQRLPSGPAAIPCGLLEGVGRGNSVMLSAGEA